MKGTDYTTKAAVLQRGLAAIGIPLKNIEKNIDKHNRLNKNKGGVGIVIEEGWFGYKPNNDRGPDFPEAGVELKVTPYTTKIKHIKKKAHSAAVDEEIKVIHHAKERLVITTIDYMTEYLKEFKESDFWHKSETILLMFYEHRDNCEKGDFSISHAMLFSFPEKDLRIIKNDWEKIIDKIKNGDAHNLSESDTNYLAACTKGENSSKMVPQPKSTELAKTRAYSLKQSYMTGIINRFVFGEEESEQIIKDPHELDEYDFDTTIVNKLSPYIGMIQTKLMETFDLTSEAKNLNELLIGRMLGARGSVSETEEFKKANIIVKTIRRQQSGSIKESMSFKTFKFTEIINQTWDTSDLKNYLEPAKFLFVIFRENNNKEYFFERVKFWSMPNDDLDEVQRVWERTVNILKMKAKHIEDDDVFIDMKLPKESENRVAHVRPHAKNRNDTYPLPGGGRFTKQCFWLNRLYVENIIKES